MHVFWIVSNGGYHNLYHIWDTKRLLWNNRVCRQDDLTNLRGLECLHPCQAEATISLPECISESWKTLPRVHARFRLHKGRCSWLLSSGGFDLTLVCNSRYNSKQLWMRLLLLLLPPLPQLMKETVLYRTQSLEPERSGCEASWCLQHQNLSALPPTSNPLPSVK